MDLTNTPNKAPATVADVHSQVRTAAPPIKGAKSHLCSNNSKARLTFLSSKPTRPSMSGAAAPPQTLWGCLRRQMSRSGRPRGCKHLKFKPPLARNVSFSKVTKSLRHLTSGSISVLPRTPLQSRPPARHAPPVPGDLAGALGQKSGFQIQGTSRQNSNVFTTKVLWQKTTISTTSKPKQVLDMRVSPQEPLLPLMALLVMIGLTNNAKKSATA